MTGMAHKINDPQLERMAVKIEKKINSMDGRLRKQEAKRSAPKKRAAPKGRTATRRAAPKSRTTARRAAPKSRTTAKRKTAKRTGTKRTGMKTKRRRNVHVVEHTRSFPGTKTYKTSRQRTTERKRIKRNWL